MEKIHEIEDSATQAARKARKVADKFRRVAKYKSTVYLDNGKVYCELRGQSEKKIVSMFNNLPSNNLILGQVESIKK